MRLIERGVWQLAGSPRDLFNVFLLGDVLVDTATRWAWPRILSQLGKRRLSLIALTHCHPDHQGCAARLCERYGVPLACHEADLPAMEGRARMEPDNRLLRLGVRFWAGRPHPVGRVLRDGDEVGGFRIVHAPGHTAGHCIYFRESDGLAIAGDVLANVHFLSGRPGLRLPPPFFCVDPEQNRRSALLLASLKPRVVCFGHGPPLRDPAALAAFAAKLAARPQRG
jgi:glyoxylase-like metal-dependent hydrolase (beta-lactamase superfamily II)